MVAILQSHFQKHCPFILIHILLFLLEILFLVMQVILVAVGSVKALTPNRRKAINWLNGDQGFH